MKNYSIIGGNIAGLATAINIKQQVPEAEIEVYEPKIWNKPCGSGISLEFYDYLNSNFGLELEEKHIANSLSFGSFYGIKKSFPSPFVVTTRLELQQKLMEIAKKEKGCVFTFDKKLKYRCRSKDIPVISLYKPGRLQLTGEIE